jgi:divinyl protochlorophyllide a 8-vinyl-reductase
MTAPAASTVGGLIGPNAILQLLPVLERVGGHELRETILASAGVFEVPSGDSMIDERPVARLHREVRRQLPDLAEAIAWEAGRRTADYILAHRIPAPVRLLLRALPRRPAARLLTGAISRHAWTFSGSGRFEVVSTRPLVFAIHNNPVVRGEHADHCLCHWHAAVFERLFQVLVDSGTRVRETACAGAGAPACRFDVRFPR